MRSSRNQPDIDAILDGNAQAFSTLVEAYKNIVYTVALRMLKNTEEAEEVAQDTFIKVFKSLHNFKRDSKLSTWIYRIAYNACLDRIKKNKKEMLNVSMDEIEGFEIAQMDNALGQLITEEKSVLVKNCVAMLSPKDAALISFFYFEEKNLSELSEILKLSENNVKVGLFRARKRLAVILKEQLNAETIGNYE